MKKGCKVKNKGAELEDSVLALKNIYSPNNFIQKL